MAGTWALTVASIAIELRICCVFTAIQRVHHVTWFLSRHTVALTACKLISTSMYLIGRV
jgi:hypothetical protein